MAEMAVEDDARTQVLARLTSRLDRLAALLERQVNSASTNQPAETGAPETVKIARRARLDRRSSARHRALG